MLDSPEREGDNAALAAADELAILRQAVAELTFERDRLLNSTLWRMVAPIRAVALRLPGPVQRALGRGVRGGLKSIGLLRGRVQAAATEAPPPPPAASGIVANRVIFVSGEPTTPGHVYRVVRATEAAARAGWDASWMPIQQAPRRMDEIGTAAIVVVWRATWSNTMDWIKLVVGNNGAKLVFDLDDLVFRTELATAETIDGIRSQKLKTDAVVAHYADMHTSLAAADACTCTTIELARHMREFDKAAFVLPNGFDAVALALSRLSVRRRRLAQDDGLVRIGYASGSRTHQRDFAEAAGAVARVLAERPHCRLVLFETRGGLDKLLDIDEFVAIEARSDQIEWWPMLPLEKLPEAMARFDINLAPLQLGNPFCDAKSELKYFEAALVEVPTIASPTGPMRRAIRDGETGLLATSEDEWYRALIALVDDAALRRRLAHAAYLDVLWPYGPERRAERMLSMLRQVQGGAEGSRAFALELSRDTAAPPQIPESETIFASDKLGEAAVTVIVPLYNYAVFITEALESVRAQTLDALDLIVIDDASTDDSLAVARDWAERNQSRFNRILVLRNRANAGLAHTRNAGFDAAETPFVLPLDADNRLLPDCCARTLAAAREAGAAFAYPAIRYFGGMDHVIGTAPFVPMKLAGGNYIDAMALVAKPAWAAVGGYAHIEHGWEDYDFWCRFAERGLLGVRVPEVLAEYRVHQASMLHTATDVAENKRQVIATLEARHTWLSIPYRESSQ
jgi:GT2 family glycosyltransferase/glycosyltransferase involved in cell wall biosynthesis